jgi:uncharacterized protein YceK
MRRIAGRFKSSFCFIIINMSGCASVIQVKTFSAAARDGDSAPGPRFAAA